MNSKIIPPSWLKLLTMITVNFECLARSPMRVTRRITGIASVWIVLCCTIPTVAAQALDKNIQADILSKKIVALIQADQFAQAVPVFEELEALGDPLPPIVQFYYIQALDKAGKAKPALFRATDYLRTYGKAARNYDATVEIVSRLTDVVKQDELRLQKQIANEEYEKLKDRQKEEKYQAALAKYNSDMDEYRQLVANSKKLIQECVPRITAELRNCEEGVKRRQGGFFGDSKKLESGYAWCWERYTPDHCERVNRVEVKAPVHPTRP